MRFQGLLRTERLRAERALVEPLAEVGHLVELEHVVVGKRFPANVARVGPLTCTEFIAISSAQGNPEPPLLSPEKTTSP